MKIAQSTNLVTCGFSILCLPLAAVAIEYNGAGLPVFNLGFLGPLSFQSGRFYENIFAAQQAIKDFKSGDAPLSCPGCNSRFDLRLIAMDDSVGGPPSQDLACEGALKLILGDKLTGFNFTSIVGLLGGQIPSNCPASVEISAAMKLPQVAWGCAMPIGTAGQYPYFYRTHQMDFYKCFGQLAKAFQWKRFSIAWKPSDQFSSSHTLNIMEKIKSSTPDAAFHLAELRNKDDGTPDYEDWQVRLKAALEKRNNIWFASVSPDVAKSLFALLAQSSFIQTWMQWVVSGSCKSSIIADLKAGSRSFLGSIVIRPYSYHTVADDWMADKIFRRIAANGKASFSIRDEAYIIDSDGDHVDPVIYGDSIKNTTPSFIADPVSGNLGGGWQSNHNWPFVYDAVYNFIYAINHLMETEGKTADEIHGATLLDAVATRDFMGTSKQVKYINRDSGEQERPGDWAIDNFQPDGSGFKIVTVGSLESEILKWRSSSELYFMNGAVWQAGDLTNLTTVPTNRLPRCLDGHVRNVSGLCNPCPPGTHANEATWAGKDDPEREICTPCPEGTFTSAEGSVRCTPCDAGTDSRNGDITTGAKVCIRCEAGSSSLGNEMCRQCRPGSYANESGMSKCSLASPGYVVSGEGATSSKKCLAGTFSRSAGNSECQSCTPGKVASQDAATSCSLCEPGQYQPYEKQVACVACPSGTTTAMAGMAWNSSCACARGTYHPCDNVDCPLPSQDAMLPLSYFEGLCVPCPIAMTCDGPMTSPLAMVDTSAGHAQHRKPYVPPGFMAIGSVVYKCSGDGSACPGAFMLDPDDVMCSDGGSGIACAHCTEGYHFAGETCVECGASGELGAVAVILAAFALSLAWFCTTFPTEPHGVVTKVTMQKQLYGMLVGSTSALVLSLIQTDSIISLLKVPLPPGLRGTLSTGGSVLNLNAFSLGCAWKGAGSYAVWRAIFANCIPGTCIMIAMLFLILSKVCSVQGRRTWPERC